MDSRTFSWLLVLTVVVATMLIVGLLVATYLTVGGSPEPSDSVFIVD